MERFAEVFPERIRTWAELTALIDHFSYFNGHAWLFRGVPNAAHGLIPKIGRETIRAKKERDGAQVRVPYLARDELAVFSMFMQQARPYLTNPPQSKLEWLAIAQHHGLPTRLLDWTDSLLVAAWFAVEPGGARTCDSAIWVARGIKSVESDFDRDPLTLNEVLCYRPPHISPRISAQSSVFVLCPKPTEPIEPLFARRVLIEPAVQFTLKKRLNACGINRKQLFPDLEGLSQHLEWMYKHDWLAGYRPDSVSAGLTPDTSPLESEE